MNKSTLIALSLCLLSARVGLAQTPDTPSCKPDFVAMAKAGQNVLEQPTEYTAAPQCQPGKLYGSTPADLPNNGKQYQFSYECLYTGNTKESPRVAVNMTSDCKVIDAPMVLTYAE